MAGKSKREVSVSSRSAQKEEASPPPPGNAQDIFRKYFEAQFEPLDLPASQQTGSAETSEDDDSEGDLEMEETGDSDWDGLSGDDEGDNKVEVIEHKDAQVISDELMDKKARKAFLVSFAYSFILEYVLISL